MENDWVKRGNSRCVPECRGGCPYVPEHVDSHEKGNLARDGCSRRVLTTFLLFDFQGLLTSATIRLNEDNEKRRKMTYQVRRRTPTDE